MRERERERERGIDNLEWIDTEGGEEKQNYNFTHRKSASVVLG